MSNALPGRHNHDGALYETRYTKCDGDHKHDRFVITGTDEWDQDKFANGAALHDYLNVCDKLKDWKFERLPSESAPWTWRASGKTHSDSYRCLEKEAVWKSAGGPGPFGCRRVKHL